MKLEPALLSPGTIGSNGAGAAAPAPLLPSGVRVPTAPGLPLDAAVVLKPTRTAATPKSGPAVLWADAVYLSSPTNGYWRLAHVGPHSADGPFPLTYKNPSFCRGQHRACSDGRVEWIKGDALSLDEAGVDLNAAASLRLGMAFWWF